MSTALSSEGLNYAFETHTVAPIPTRSVDDIFRMVKGVLWDILGAKRMKQAELDEDELVLRVVVPVAVDLAAERVKVRDVRVHLEEALSKSGINLAG